MIAWLKSAWGYLVAAAVLVAGVVVGLVSLGGWRLERKKAKQLGETSKDLAAELATHTCAEGESKVQAARKLANEWIKAADEKAEKEAADARTTGVAGLADYLNRSR